MIKYSSGDVINLTKTRKIQTVESAFRNMVSLGGIKYHGETSAAFPRSINKQRQLDPNYKEPQDQETLWPFLLL